MPRASENKHIKTSTRKFRITMRIPETRYSESEENNVHVTEISQQINDDL